MPTFCCALIAFKSEMTSPQIHPLTYLWGEDGEVDLPGRSLVQMVDGARLLYHVTRRVVEQRVSTSVLQNLEEKEVHKL